MDNENICWLHGWKKISKYLGRTPRTLLRWEKAGMPVLRDPAGRPIAKPEHIDKWLIDMNREKNNDGEWTQPGVETALEYEREAAQEKAEFDEKVIHAQRLNRGQY